MYIIFGTCMGIIGAIFSHVIRLELAHPGGGVLNSGAVYNALVTGHGLIMIFYMIMPVLISGFGN